MREERPKCVSICLAPRQIGLLDQLCAAYRHRSENTSRSALVRRALNAGIETLLRDADLDDDLPDDEGSPAAGVGDEHGVLAAAVQ